MSAAFERRRASRLSDNVGALLIVLGGAGFVGAAVITGWIIHDLDKAVSGLGVSTISKLQAVAIAGLTPGMLSLLVIAFGVYLQTRSTELLFGAVGDRYDDDADEDDEVGELT